MSVICNNCGEDIIYINARKATNGIAKCDPDVHIAYQASGRQVEVYLVHECSGSNDRQCGEFFKKEDDQERLRLSDDTPPSREDNPGNRE